MIKAILGAVLTAGTVSLLMCGASLAARKTELVLAIGGEPDGGYDPLIGWGRYGHPLFQSTLLTRDAALATLPDLATEWSLSDDRLVWTLKLRTDAKFSDGTPLTAKDVAFTFNEAAKAGGSLDLTVLDSATAIDDATVEIRLKQPWITFTDNFYTLGIVPAAIYGEGYGRKPVGFGPYKLVSWTEGEQLVVEQNPNYYGKQSPFSKITFLFAGEDTSLAAAQAGLVDMVTVAPALADAPPAEFRQVVAFRRQSRHHLPDAPRCGADRQEGI